MMNNAIRKINIPDLREKLKELLEIEERNSIFFLTRPERREFQSAVNEVLDFAEEAQTLEEEI